MRLLTTNTEVTYQMNMHTSA